MIFGLGTDIIEIDRIAAALERQGEAFLDRVFTEAEQEYCQSFKQPERHYAGRFAAKEAISTALGTGIGHTIAWGEVEILAHESGQPYAVLPNELCDKLAITRVHVSISHGKDYATAVAIIETSEQ